MQQINVGDRVGSDIMDQLPLTTRINLQGTNFVRILNGRWAQADNPRTIYSSKDFDTAVIAFLPSPVEVPVTVETFAAWQWRFVDAARRGADNYGVRNLLDSAFREIGVEENPPAVPLPPGYQGTGDAMVDAMPVGTLIAGYHGSTPRVWKKVADSTYGWRRVCPPGSRTDNRPEAYWTLVRWGEDGPTEPEDVEVNEQDRILLAETKAKAWRVGMVLKRRHSWCETLESILRAGGVTEQDASGGGVGMEKEEVRDLPVGTVLFWHSRDDAGRWSLMVRDDSAGNRSQTRWLIGTTPIRHTRDRMQVVWRPGSDMGIVLPTIPPTPQVLELLPVGWQFQLLEGGGPYRVDDRDEFGDRRFAHLNGDRVSRRHNAIAFGGTQRLVVTHIPGVSDRESVSA